MKSRLLTLKTYRRQLRAAQTVAVESAPSPAALDTRLNSAALEQQEAAIQAEREALDRRAAEIVTKEARISHLLNDANSKLLAAESERTAFHGAQKDLLCERNSLSQLRRDLASRESGIAEREVLAARKLEDMRSRFNALEVRAAELKQQESEIDSRSADVHRRVHQLKTDLQAQRDAISRETTIDNTQGAAFESAADVLVIRQQLEEMQQALTSTENNRDAMLGERDSLLSAVKDLQKALQNARQDVEDANRVKDESAKQEERLKKAYQDLEEQERRRLLHESNLLLATEELETLRTDIAEIVQEREELKTKLANQSMIADDASSLLPVVDSNVGETFTQQARELDERAELLDLREHELRERDRKIVQSESEVEAQRRQLLEARQQLELARAEIQLAMRRQVESATNADAGILKHSEHAVPNDNLPDLLEDRHEVSRYDIDDADPKPATDLRSELAGLFGLRKPASENQTPPPVPPSEFMDLSEPTGENKAVAFHFGSADARFTPTESESATAADAGVEPARDENSDDFVRDYMEQLLSRNRKSAGGVLPGELKPTENKKNPVAASAA
ncbi:MAG: hypothetical protein O2856_08220, partial [Planctomycetota bacterium]|nr:hypothetical protein [Planctomycetota bacterium]